MIVKGTKQLGSFKRGVNLYTPKKIISQAAQVVWKVAIYGAGTPTSNGEYVWDGETYAFGRPKYFNGTKYIEWNGVDWIIFDTDLDGGTVTYISSDLATWTVFEGASPAPSSSIAYSQDSNIRKIIVFGAGESSSNGEYVWDGNELQDGKPVYRNGSNTISFGDFGGGSAEWGLYDDIVGDNTYLSSDLLNWTSNGYGTAPASALSYAQDSEIQSITLSGAGTSTSNGEYVWDGTTLINGKPKYESGINYIYWYTDAIFPEIQSWSLFDDYDGQDNYSSDDLITWTESNGQSPAPSVLALVYTA